MAYSEHLKKLILCLEAMREHCQSKDWAALAEREKEREELISLLKPMKADNSPETIKLINKTLQLNQQVIESAENNKNESEKSLLDIKRNLKKTAQYYSK